MWDVLKNQVSAASNMNWNFHISFAYVACSSVVGTFVGSQLHDTHTQTHTLYCR